jgi:hypothetical protein
MPGGANQAQDQLSLGILSFFSAVVLLKRIVNMRKHGDGP